MSVTSMEWGMSKLGGFFTIRVYSKVASGLLIAPNPPRPLRLCVRNFREVLYNENE